MDSEGQSTIIPLKKEEDDINEFAPLNDESTEEKKPVEVKLESKGEIISSVFESKVTQDASERKALLTVQYGDLPVNKQGSRKFEEAIWTNGKQLLQQTLIPPLFISKEEQEKNSFLVCCTNGTFCFGFTGEKKLVDDYLKMQQGMELFSYKQELGHRLFHMETQGDAQEFLVLLQVLLKREPTYETILKDFMSKVEKKLPTLPEGKETYNQKVHVTDRVFPVIKTLEHTILTAPEERKPQDKYDTFTLYFCNTSKEKKIWKAAPLEPFKVAEGSVPCVAANETHLAILYQPYDEPDPSVIRVSLYRLNDAPSKAPCETFHFQFPKEHFRDEGLLRLNINNEGVVVVSFANGAIIFGQKDQKEEARVVRIVICSSRLVTASMVHSTDTIILGTDAGECFGVKWDTGDVLFSEMTPIIEPIYSLAYSNKRVVMHTASALSGKMTPYLSEHMTHLPNARITGFDICGTLLFAVEKYGGIQVFSTLARSVLFPFKQPKEETQHESGFTLSHYQSIKATNDKITVLYPNGLIRIFCISNKGFKWIEDRLDEQKKKKPNKKKEKEKKNQKK